MKFYDKRLGQSTTLTGRNIVRHMNAKINEIITGEYDYKGEAIIYADTDSVAADSIIDTNYGKMAIEEFFNLSAIKWQEDEKQYACDDKLSVPSYDPYDNTVTYKIPKYVYRHKVKKQKWRITDVEGNAVVVTSDHSIMVERGADIYEIKPKDLQLGDILISYTKQ